MTKKQRRLTAEEAKILYLEQDGGRSLRRLHRFMQEHPDIKAPAWTTLANWSKEGKWVESAQRHDEEITARVARKLATDAVKEHVDLAKQMRDLSSEMMKKARKLATDDAKEQDIAALVTGAIALAKQASVTEGGVSDRTSFLDGPAAADEAERQTDDYRKQGLEALQGLTETTH